MESHQVPRGTPIGTIAVLGAGAMGSAFTVPLSDAGIAVRLWGTTLDTEILAGLRAGALHPRTGERIPPRVELFEAHELDRCLEGADLIAIVVSSEGVGAVMSAAAARMVGARAVLVLSKGFAVDPVGRVELLSDAVARMIAVHGPPPPLVTVGGPCKASELAAGRPTRAVFAGPDQAIVEAVADRLGGARYQIDTLDDASGLGAASALKNVYAIGIGICDGLPSADGRPWNGLKAAVFSQALREMAVVMPLVGGQPETVLGLGGAGDLHLTGTSGRNHAYGTLVGRGISADVALTTMQETQQTVEGPAAAPLAAAIVAQRGGPDAGDRLPLLATIGEILSSRASVDDLPDRLWGAVRPDRLRGIRSARATQN